MLITIAWRNIWRNKVRSLVVIIAIALGLWGGVFFSSFSWGMNDSRAKNMIETQLSHIQIHTPAYKDEPKVTYFLPDGKKLLSEVRQNKGILASTGRIKVNGMISSSKGGLGVQIHGITPDEEALVTRLSDKVVEGEYFGQKRNQILVGQKMADRLKLRLNKKVVLTYQNVEGDMTATAFRIAGFFKTVNSKYDEVNVFVRARDLEKNLGSTGEIHEIAILLDNQNMVDSLKNKLQLAHSELLVEDWKDMAPDLKFVAESMRTFMQVFMAIFMLGMAFGIINTMLMAVLERTRELGMLMSIGMNKVKVFFMIMLETIFLSLIGGPLGMLIAYGFVSFFGIHGIDLSFMKEGLASFGMTNTVYTHLAPIFYFDIAVMVLITAILSSIYPAIKALKLKPVEALRTL